jgi:hypothetical protein
LNIRLAPFEKTRLTDSNRWSTRLSYHLFDPSTCFKSFISRSNVWYQIPKQLRRPYSVVLVHGGGQTGTNFLRTPDGRPGWADFFLQEGYTVYVIDWPGQGKSNYVAPVYGPPGLVPTKARERQFTAPKEFTDNWPQAQKHMQWPGSGRKGDPIFDHFLASQSITPTEIVKGAAPLNEKLTADSVTSFERESLRICECYNLGRGVVPTVFWGY